MDVKKIKLNWSYFLDTVKAINTDKIFPIETNEQLTWFPDIIVLVHID